MTIQERIEYLLNERKISKAELARRIERPYTTVDNWFKRNSEPGCTLAEPIAKALDVSIEFLITGTEKIIPGTVLPDEEQQLLDYYNAANQDGKVRIMEQAEFLAAKYPQQGKSSEYKIG